MTFGTPTTSRSQSRRQVPASAAFLLAAFWVAITLAAGSEAAQAVSPVWSDLIRYGFTAGALITGFFFLARASISDLRPWSSLGFVQRPGIATEFGIGAALGWAIALALVLPVVLTGNLAVTVHVSAASLVRTFWSCVELGLFAVVVQGILTGLPARLLLRSVGPAWTYAAVILVAVTVAALGQTGQGSSLLFVALGVGLLIAAFLRTRAIWLPLGIQIGWTVSLGLIFGASSPYEPSVYGLVTSDSGGPLWLTGGPFGPEASLIAIPILIAALVVLFRVTRTYAWHYTYQPIEGAGYPMDVPPPAEHLREEAKHAQPLVQIAGVPGPVPAPVPPTVSQTNSSGT